MNPTNLLSIVKKFIGSEFFRFLLVGGINTLFGYLIYAIIVFVTKNPSVSVILSNIIAILFNFKTYGRFVFGSHKNTRIIRFIAAYGFFIVTQIYAIKALAYLGVQDPYLAGGILVLPMAGLSFVLLRKFVFASPEVPK